MSKPVGRLRTLLQNLSCGAVGVDAFANSESHKLLEAIKNCEIAHLHKTPRRNHYRYVKTRYVRQCIVSGTHFKSKIIINKDGKLL